MKKSLMLISLIACIMACNNANDSSGNTDRAGNAVADSSAVRQGGDTSSYEHMPNKISDTTPQ